MPALHPKEYWEATGRWESFDTLYRLKAHEDREFALGPTHEEILTPLVTKFISSYRDLPISLYQIQTKFRDEPRAKSGVLRGREFLMKDMYSFHASREYVERYYERVKAEYQSLFSSLGLDAYCTEASGGTFSKYSHEFQVLTSAGEDTISYCAPCHFARNKAIMQEMPLSACPRCQGSLETGLASEVGNIFNLGTKFSETFQLQFTDEQGNKHPVIMGCYGIGISRLMGVLVEVSHDYCGIIWPRSCAPFDIHVLALGGHDTVKAHAHRWYETLQHKGLEVLYDDRDISSGEKLKDADLIGIPLRLVVSEKTGENVEVKRRTSADATVMTKDELIKYVFA